MTRVALLGAPRSAGSSEDIALVPLLTSQIAGTAQGLNLEFREGVGQHDVATTLAEVGSAKQTMVLRLRTRTAPTISVISSSTVMYPSCLRITSNIPLMV